MTDGGVLHLESGFPYETRRGLIDRGHRIGTGGHYGGYHAIMRIAETGVYLGACESRQDGAAAGY